MTSSKDSIKATALANAALVQSSQAVELVQAPVATFFAECLGAKPGLEQRVADTQAQIHHLRTLSLMGRVSRVLRARFEDGKAEADRLHAWMCAELMAPKWSEQVSNLVLTAGKTDLLDKYLSGSSYTAAWYCLLISSVSYSAIAAGDTMASHAGWLEAGGTNAPTYTGSRPALTFAAASGGTKSTSSASSFSFSGPGTIKGMGAVANATKDGTTGPLYNAVLFTGGDRIVATSDVVNVSATYSA